MNSPNPRTASPPEAAVRTPDAAPAAGVHPGPPREPGGTEPAPAGAPVPGTPAHGPAAATARFAAPLTRRRTGRLLGGVSGGVADHVGVDVRWVRAAFVVLTFLGWAGVLAYGLLWTFVRQEEDPVERTVTRSERLQAAGLLALGLGLSLVAATSGASVLGWIAGPLGLATVGAAVVWREADEAQRRRWARDARSRVVGGRAALLRTLLGASLVLTGLAVFLVGNLDLGQVRFGILAAVATLLGVAVLTVPWWLRLVRDLGEERQARAVEAERVEIAAHLHDSVLQTLALIQRQAGNSREVQRLARGQERELRAWLYGPGGRARGGDGSAAATETTLSAAITRVAGEVEDTYAVTVGPVVVGDAELNGDLRALVLAAREAMVNSAKHSGCSEVDVYVEVEPGDDDEPGTAEVFVRDRGHGFDPDAVDGDRHGLADSVHERMRRHGGTVRIRTGAGEGTEVRLSMPLGEKETA
ncbi:MULTISPECIES: ATP-binding protein [Pseudonocardia]|uniref:Histidine kinase n=1 Tax=Pseudonocardia saturnea TaxID=33909 RepID=A0ABQ0S4Q4_9PSEU|nr:MULTISPECIES: ATP-binding protein [Pseudonocardia]BBG04545.1 histidine kinase [Pseudonocardia autotrophica]GEC27871.1 histidine kinase [Pseudonocardia saturnea]